ncbi:MAG: GNAT family N-acetyltransferase, partial [Ruminococcus sp.]|nr:GNAT family N-acetyltransferase [Ruminococcus sp.]
NKGYTTEATKAMIDFAKENLNVKQLYAQHHVDNPASGKVMMKNGFVPTGYGEFTTFNGDVRKSRTYILDL